MSLHYLPDKQQDEHVSSPACVCSPELVADGSYYHRRSHLFGWTYPCCGAEAEARAYAGLNGHDPRAMAAVVDSLPHICV